MNNDIGFLIKQIGKRMKESFDSLFGENGLTSQQGFILFLLQRNNGTLSQKDIEVQLQVSHPTVVGLIQRLENNGFVRTYTADEDRRMKMVELTEKSRELHEKINRNRSYMENKLVENISDEQQEELICLLNKIIDNLDRKGEDAYV